MVQLFVILNELLINVQKLIKLTLPIQRWYRRFKSITRGSNEVMLPVGLVDVCTVSNAENSTTNVTRRNVERFEYSDEEAESHCPAGVEEITVLYHYVWHPAIEDCLFDRLKWPGVSPTV
jgi:hypothetical protein